MAGFPKAGDQYGGRYRIVSEVGHGGMGVVYEALDTVLNRSVALKIVLPSLGDRDEYHQRFALEAAALARIQSRHIVGIYDYGEHDDTVFFATQFFPDGDLQSWLDEHGPLARRAALSLVAQVAEALADAHAAGVVHRDVKPSNVLLWARPEGLIPYLADFGIAVEGEPTKRSGLTRTGTLIGSPAYMAPERHFGHPADERGDIYTAGCLLWISLTGDAPYSGTDFQMMNAHINAPVVSLGTGHPVDDRIDEVLAGALEKDPDRRIGSAAELQARLTALVRDLDTGALPMPLPPGSADQAAMPAPPTERAVVRPIAVPGVAVGPEPTPAEPEPVGAATADPVVEEPAALGAAPPSRATPPPSIAGRPRRRRWLTPVLAGAAAIVVVAATTAAIATMGEGDPSAGDDPSPTATADSATSEPLTAPTAPQVRAASGYRKVTFAFSGAPDAALEVNTGNGWRPHAGKRLALPTRQGGDQQCVRARTVIEAEGQTASSDPVRTCGKAEPRSVQLVPTPGACSATVDGFTFGCQWYGVRLAGFVSDSTQQARMHEVGQPDNCPTDSSCQAIPVGKDGRARVDQFFRVLTDSGRWVIDVDGVAYRTSLTGP